MINKFEYLVRGLTWCAAQIAKLALVVIMLVIVANVILRIPWRPIGGTVEIVEMAGAVLLSLGIAYTAINRGHIAVGVLVERLPIRIQGLVETAVCLISLFFSFILARELVFYAIKMADRGYVTGHLGIPIAPSIFLTAFGFIMFSAVLVLHLFEAIKTVAKGRNN